MVLCNRRSEVTFVDAINIKNNVNAYKMVFTAEDRVIRVLIKMLRQDKKYDVKKFIAEFPSKPWTLPGLNKLLRKIDTDVLG